ncbi:hypothetical protein ACFVSN_30965 [Kitasatospora sp. NPDC057904]|uniref:hypothetical protein n=1 Tax=Kitasatospora sp. NPDC057904 TaxID=3346275 RepID=UPI0036D965D0
MPADNPGGGLTIEQREENGASVEDAHPDGFTLLSSYTLKMLTDLRCALDVTAVCLCMG